ncbi:MAG: hypothetical protein BGO24_03625 [Sphingomonas sp. 67-36]|nr:MAG: hypothetical protein BGO24_03625 [Sphingomonas sp. 67-36]
MGPMPRENLTSLGWALTVTIWLLAALMMLSAFAGECVPQAGDACAGGRTMTLLWIAAGAAALNALAVGLVAWLRRR